MGRTKISTTIFERFEIVKKDEWFVLRDKKWCTFLESDKGTIAFKSEDDAIKYMHKFFKIGLSA